MPQQVQCPKCAQSVTVDEQSAGKRLRCPHCSKEFLAPGIVASSSDDDDWLALETDPSPVAEPPALFEPPLTNDLTGSLELPRTTEQPAVDDLAVDDDSENSKESDTPNDLSVFGSALQEFTSGVESLPSPESGNGEEGAFADLPPMDSNPTPMSSFPSDSSVAPSSSPPMSNPPTSAPTAESAEYATEYRVRCKTCDSLLYAKASQQGRYITCGDCHSKVKVPPPPKVKKKKSIDIENAQTFHFEDAPERPRTKDPFQKSAEELLDEAARETKVEPVPNTDNPDVREWAKDVFGIFLDPGVMVRWIGLSTLGAIPAYIAIWSESQVLYLGLIIGGILLTAMTVIYGFAIMQSVANQCEQVEHWPESDPGAWADELLLAICAFALAGGPIWTIVMVTSGFSLLGLAATLLSIFALFPFIVLSMLDMRSIFSPFSPEVARSVTKAQEAWGALYLSSGILFFGFFVFATLLSTSAPAAGTSVAVFAAVAVVFCYFGMIGRLAYQVGQEVNQPGMSVDGAPETEQ